MRIWVALVALLVTSTGAEAGRKKKGKKKTETTEIAVHPSPTAAPAALAPRAHPGNGDPISLPCDWPEGAEFHYIHTRKRTNSQYPMLAKVTAIAPIDVTVAESGNPTRFRYAVGHATFNGPPEIVEPLKPMLAAVDLIPLELIMEDGVLSDIRNHLEVVDAMEPGLRKIMPPNTPSATIDTTLAMFRDPTTGPGLLLKDPRIFFAMHCTAIAQDQVVVTKSQTTSPFGGPPIPGTSIIRYLSHDADTVTIETIDRLDSEGLKAMLPSIIEKFEVEGNGLEDIDIDEVLAAMPPIDHRMTAQMVYSRADGFPISIEVHQELGGPNHPQNRSDTWIWTRVDAD